MNIPFTDNYKDLSTSKGYQFKFFCERCGNGYISSFQSSATGIISNVLGIVSSFFGGDTYRWSRTSDDVHRFTSGSEHDKALKKAVKEMRPKFKQCSRCGEWVCKEVCWNEERGLCKNCAPELGEEMAAAQAQHATQEAHAHARMSEEEKHLSEEDWKEQKKAVCPNCGAKLKAHADFCPECGEEIVKKKKCPKCGEKVSASQKFCDHCGSKLKE
jgi:hypothetical protein